MNDVSGAPVMSGLNVWSETHPDSVGTIAMPLRDHITAATHTSFMKADYRWTDGKPITKLYVQGSQLPLQRNEAVLRMQGGWLLFVDDDMSFDKDAIGQLVSSYHRIKEEVSEPVMVGGLCVRRYPPYQPTIFQTQDYVNGPFNYLEDWEGADVVEADATGSAFVLIEEDVFGAIMGGPFPSYEDRLGLTPWPFYEWIGTMGEDLRFCLKAKAAGCRIFVDTRVRIGHVGEKIFDITDFWHAVSERPKAMEETRRLLNDEMKMPTLTAEEARARL